MTFSRRFLNSTMYSTVERAAAESLISCAGGSSYFSTGYSGLLASATSKWRCFARTIQASLIGRSARSALNFLLGSGLSAKALEIGTLRLQINLEQEQLPYATLTIHPNTSLPNSLRLQLMNSLSTPRKRSTSFGLDCDGRVLSALSLLVQQTPEEWGTRGKKLWIEGVFPEEMEPIKGEFKFIQAKASDNPHLTKKYYQNLLTLTPWMAKAFARATVIISQGQHCNFVESRHTYAANEIKIEPWWVRWISMDWGYDHPGCVHWHAIDENQRIYTYRELYGPGISEKRWGEEISDLSRGEKIRDFFISPDADAKRSSANTIREEIGEHLDASIPRPSDADNGRVAGWRLLHQLLDADLWLINRDACPKLVESLPTLIRDAPDNSEDVLKIDHSENTIGDDAPDCARYGLKTKLAPRGKPISVRVDERIAAVQKSRTDVGLPPQTDPTALAMMARVALSKEKKQEKPVSLITRGRWQRHRIHP